MAVNHKVGGPGSVPNSSTKNSSAGGAPPADGLNWADGAKNTGSPRILLALLPSLSRVPGCGGGQWMTGGRRRRREKNFRGQESVDTKGGCLIPWSELPPSQWSATGTRASPSAPLYYSDDEIDVGITGNLPDWQLVDQQLSAPPVPRPPAEQLAFTVQVSLAGGMPDWLLDDFFDGLSEFSAGLSFTENGTSKITYAMHVHSGARAGSFTRVSSVQGVATNNNLPPEIIDKILLLLPARSVFRFRAVCRSWAARLSSPSFTNAYAAATDARRTHNKLVVLAPSSGPSTVVYSCSSNEAAVEPLLTLDHIRTDFLSLSSRPSRGLLLLSDTRAVGRYWVCNPSTGECRALPPPPERSRVSLSSAGLAFDDLTMECKVVHLFFFVGRTEVNVRCEVLTLGAHAWRWRPAACTGLNQCSRDIVEALLVEEAVAKAPPVFADGCLHWLMRYPRRGRRVDGVLLRQGQDAILRFSAADESFGLVSAPESVPFEDYIRLEEHLPMVPVHLAELKGLLCMVHDLRHRGSQLDVWARSVQGEWSLGYRIPVSPLLSSLREPQFITVLGSTSNERLLLATSEHKVYSYATDTRRVETVFAIGETSIGQQKEAPAELRLGLYEDSLIRIGGADRVSSAVAQVLLRLPLESIVQSKLLSREWRALIESESFAAAHLSIKRPRRIFIATNGRARGSFFRFAPLQSWLRASPADLANSLVVDSNIVCSSKPCHGLNLISTGTDDYLCNPCTGAIECLGIRGRSHFTPYGSSATGQPSRRHAFTVGRSVGLGFDHNTGEHVAVEIGNICGALACILKASESDSWTCAGTPPMPVTDMPPAHVDGTLYWLGRREQRVLVILCEQPNLNHHHGATTFLVELNNTLSLVVADSEPEEMEIWMMNIRLRAWTAAAMVVPIEINGDEGRILLSTGRALGYYDTKTGAIDTIYSLDLLQLPPCAMASPILCEESLVPVHNEDVLPLDRVAPPSAHGHMCQSHGCQGIGTFYSRCSTRMLCTKCTRRAGSRHFCYYYSSMNDDGDVLRHVFISRRDLVLGVLPCRLTECAYRMNGHGDVIETWALRHDVSPQAATMGHGATSIQQGDV
ncbi:hypothetical protein HU200_020515 [Digitaria exilis]|uniref:F-box domain-containing protein n=1 Tax=Digitaria exilis TaxID=1010633 RepID=A0A835F216_9POAL|nr:hypothetical protein HU200_020515 [Digitaria exilis]